MQSAARLPDRVQDAIENLVGSIPARELGKAAAELSRNYREPSPQPPPIASLAQRLAYLAVRMPAIFAVNQAAASELHRLRPDLAMRSVLDLGCGPGTATLAALQTFSELEAATLADRDVEWLKLGNGLIAAADARLADAAHFGVLDLRGMIKVGEHDLVVVSYVLGELPPPLAKTVVQHAWALARRAIIIIEPGTPRGFAAVLAARDALIAAQAAIVAPCTHAGRCPLAAGDWCHFDTRVERTQQHQQAKAATLPYEVEKFSYVIAAKEQPAEESRAARILRHPLKKSGHVILDLCTAGSKAQRVIVSRRDKESYRRARTAKWGDLWDPLNRDLT
jgi:ribosomal protein RSM22 (predicted rRNA methylase)